MIKPEELKIGNKYFEDINETNRDYFVLDFIGTHIVVVSKYYNNGRFKYQYSKELDYFWNNYSEIKQKPKIKLVKVADYVFYKAGCDESYSQFRTYPVPPPNDYWKLVIGSERTIEIEE